MIARSVERLRGFVHHGREGRSPAVRYMPRPDRETIVEISDRILADRLVSVPLARKHERSARCARSTSIACLDSGMRKSKRSSCLRAIFNFCGPLDAPNRCTLIQDLQFGPAGHPKRPWPQHRQREKSRREVGHGMRSRWLSRYQQRSGFLQRTQRRLPLLDERFHRSTNRYDRIACCVPRYDRKAIHRRDALPNAAGRLDRRAILDPPHQLQHHGRRHRCNGRRADVRKDVPLEAVQDIRGVHRRPTGQLLGMPLPRSCLERRCLLDMADRSGLLARDAVFPAPGAKAGGRCEQVKPAAIGKLALGGDTMERRKTNAQGKARKILGF